MPINSRHPLLRAALAALMLLPLGGCATYQAYPGDGLPDELIARIDIVPSTITLNGDPIDGRRYRTVEVLPGRHRIEWVYEHSNGWKESQQLVLTARAGRRYHMRERFIPVPHTFGPVVEAGEAILGTVVDAATLPLRLVLPGGHPPSDPPEGELFVWIEQRDTSAVVAGYSPEVPQPHPPIMAIELDDELLR